MKRALLCLPLLAIAPLFCFLGGYLDGAGVLGGGAVSSGIAMFILPWSISLAYAVLVKARMSLRVLCFILTLVIQGVVLFAVVPPEATCEMMGIAHRLRNEFSTDELRNCADHLRQKFRDGTLSVSARSGDAEYFDVDSSAMVVSRAELSDSLRGRFLYVFIQKPDNSDEAQVIFALKPELGIICHASRDSSPFFVRPLADGVDAYSYNRF